MNPMEIASLDVTADVTEMAPTSDGYGNRCQKIATRKGTVQIMVDLELLRGYARAALSSKGGKCSGMNGAVVCRVIRGSVLETPVPAAAPAQ